MEYVAAIRKTEVSLIVQEKADHQTVQTGSIITFMFKTLCIEGGGCLGDSEHCGLELELFEVRLILNASTTSA